MQVIKTRKIKIPEAVFILFGSVKIINKTGRKMEWFLV